LLIDSLLTPIVESTYLNRDMCKFESSQKDESRWQSTDSSKAYRNTSAFKCRRQGERISTRHAFLKCLKCAEAREKLTFFMRCKREKILLPSNSRKNVDFDLLIEQQNRIFWDDLIYLKRLAKGDKEAWKMLNDHERRTIYKERNKTKLRFVKKFIWIRDKQRCHIVGLRQDLAKNAKEKKSRKNARDTQRFRKRRRTRKMQAVLAEAQKMILNKSSIELVDHDKALLCKGLRFAPTPNWNQSVENAEWLNVHQHIRRTEWSAMLGEKNDGDFVLPKN